MEQFRELEEDLSALFPTLDKKSLRNLGSFFKKQTRFFDYNRRKLQDEKGNNDVRKTRQRRRGNGRGGLMKAGLLVLMIDLPIKFSMDKEFFKSFFCIFRILLFGVHNPFIFFQYS